MAQVVQARCPHCRNTLRVPADWLGRTMRCKFCKNTFQARQHAAPAGGPAVPTAKPAAAPPVNGAARAAPVAVAAPPQPAADSFTFEDDDAPAVDRPRKRGGGLTVALVCGGLLFLFVAPAALGLALYFGGFFNSAVVIDPADSHVADADPGSKGGVKGKVIPVGNKDLLPRRALLINVNNYLYLNSVNYGRDVGSSIGAIKSRLPNPPMRIPATQIFELSDGGPSPHPTERTVVKAAIQDFLESSRAQDRVVLLFAGHATDIEKKSYLIPIAGKKDDPETLIPLDWVLGELAKCKARQKVLILDVFRYPPALGFELPGAGASEEGEMGEDFEENLKNPPPGVQVWVSCSQGQRSIEFEGGSVFLHALYQAIQNPPAMTGFVDGNDPMPIDQAMVEKVNQRIKELVGPQKFEQVSKLTGQPLPSGAPFDPSEPVAPTLALKQPEVPGGAQAGHAAVNSILSEIRLLPPVRQTRAGEDRLLQATNLPAFPAKALEEYKADGYKFADELREQFKKDPKAFYQKQPIRAAVFDAVEVLEKGNKISMRESVPGPIDPKQKAVFLAEQREPGLMIFDLEQLLGRMQSLEEDLEKEPSKRWRANFEFTMNRVKSRLVYIYEYSYVLGQIRRDELPTLEGNQDGWRIGSRKKIQVNESKVKAYAKEIRKTWNHIQEEYPDTPWAVLAHRENLISLGLEWRAKSDQ